MCSVCGEESFGTGNAWGLILITITCIWINWTNSSCLMVKMPWIMACSTSLGIFSKLVFPSVKRNRTGDMMFWKKTFIIWISMNGSIWLFLVIWQLKLIRGNGLLTFNYIYWYFLVPSSIGLFSNKQDKQLTFYLVSWKGIKCWLDEIREVMRLLEYCNLITVTINMNKQIQQMNCAGKLTTSEVQRTNNRTNKRMAMP